MIGRALSWVVAGPLRFLVVAAWLVAAAIAMAALPGITQDRSAPIGIAPGARTAGNEARAREVAAFGFPLTGEVALVQRNPAGLSEDAKRRVFERAAAIDQHRSPVPGVTGAIPILNDTRAVPGSREDGTTAVTLLFPDPNLGLYRQYLVARRYAHTEVKQPGDHLVGLTGAVPGRAVQGDIIDSALPVVELATVVLIALLIGWRFRAVGAPLVTVVTAAVAYVVSSHVVAWAALRFGLSIPIELQPLLVVLVVAVTTDYAIFLLSGARAAMLAGERPSVAARLTLEEFAPIIITAALAVAGCTACLAFSSLDFLRVLGPALGLSVLVAMLVTLTLTPALVALLGPFTYWPSLQERHDAPGRAYEGDGDDPGALRRFAARLHTNRLVATLLVVAIVAGLALAASGLQQLRVGVAVSSDLPSDRPEARAADAAARGFAPGVTAPTVVVVEGAGVAGRTDSTDRLEDLLRKEPGVAGVVGPREEPNRADPGLPRVFTSRDGGAVRYAVILSEEPFGADAIADVRHLKGDLPRLAAASGLGGTRVSLTGDTVAAAETVSGLGDSLPYIAVAIAAVDLVVMALLLRALMAPLLLLGASVLAAAAPLGLLAIVFTRLGHPYQDFYVPLGAGVLLVALGSDYNLFVVGRIWDRLETETVREAVRSAGPPASRAIGTAALALALSFALLAVVPLTSFRAFAFAMCAGALIDSFVVRAHLVPALLALFGRMSAWPHEHLVADRTRPQVA